MSASQQIIEAITKLGQATLGQLYTAVPSIAASQYGAIETTLYSLMLDGRVSADLGLYSLVKA